MGVTNLLEKYRQDYAERRKQEYKVAQRDSQGQITDEQFDAWFPDPSQFPTHLYDLLTQICYSALKKIIPHPNIDVANFMEIFFVKAVMVLDEIGDWRKDDELTRLHWVFTHDYIQPYGNYIGRLGPDPMGWFDGSAEVAMKTDLMENQGYSEADAERTAGLLNQGFIRKFYRKDDEEFCQIQGITFENLRHIRYRLNNLFTEIGRELRDLLGVKEILKQDWEDFIKSLTEAETAALGLLIVHDGSGLSELGVKGTVRVHKMNIRKKAQKIILKTPPKLVQHIESEIERQVDLQKKGGKHYKGADARALGIISRPKQKEEEFEILGRATSVTRTRRRPDGTQYNTNRSQKEVEAIQDKIVFGKSEVTYEKDISTLMMQHKSGKLSKEDFDREIILSGYDHEKRLIQQCEDEEIREQKLRALKKKYKKYLNA